MRFTIPTFVLIASAGLALATSADAQVQRAVLAGHIPRAELSASLVGQVDTSQQIKLGLALPLRNQAGLDELLENLYDPTSSYYEQYLTPAQFTAMFGPTESDYDRVIAFVRASGLTVTKTWPNRVLLDVSGSAGTIESTFGVHLEQFAAPDGHIFYGPDTNPSVPIELSGTISGVIGLDNVARMHSDAHPVATNPFATGTGPGGNLAPADTKLAYDMTMSQTGSGQTIALFELDTFDTSDIAGYESEFSIRNGPTITPIGVDGFDTGTTPGGGQAEVTLDIDCLLQLAPSAKTILVYEGDLNGGSPTYNDMYNKIATDNKAKTVSTSWGLDEGDTGQSAVDQEETYFKEMATQGQSMFAAAGDNGAYDNASVDPTVEGSLSVDDPGSDPYVCDVGGTDLFLNNNGTYDYETAWGYTGDTRNSPRGAGGGGGISWYWTIPSYQPASIISKASEGSTTMRNCPDVSFYGDYDDGGYAIFLTIPGDKTGSWVGYNGTSAAAPLWAAFMTDVNQARVAAGDGTIGWVNPTIYPIANSTKYNTDFHDVTQHSGAENTNLYYPTEPGYDLATGWGSPVGASLFKDLVPGSAFIALQNPTSNDVEIWTDVNRNITSFGTISKEPPTGWKVVGFVDVNHDGQPDIILQNDDTGNITAWEMNGTTKLSTVINPPAPPAGWQVVSVADFNGDGNPDILLQNKTTRALSLWLMDSGFAKQMSTTNITQVPAVGWKVAGAADFNGDGKADILFQNDDTRQMAVWYMNGATRTGTATISTIPTAGSIVRAVFDLNGQADIILQVGNDVDEWKMTGVGVTSQGPDSMMAGTGWLVAGPR